MSPTPVVALILHAWPKQGPLGLVLVRHALPASPLQQAEDWRHAALRTARQELNIALDPNHLAITRPPITTPDNRLVLFVEHTGDVLLEQDLLQASHVLITATPGIIQDLVAEQHST